ncbi:MAG: alpha/beta fold hydrolase [Hyphomicrobiales bacterium]
MSRRSRRPSDDQAAPFLGAAALLPLLQMVGKPALVMLPALGCDAALYEEVAAGLADIVVPQTIVCDGETIGACIEQVLAAAPSQFIVLGTSFGGRVALETALAAPGRIKGLWIVGAGPGRVADPAAGRERSRRIRGGEFEAVIAEMAEKAVYEPGPNGAAARDRALRMLRRIDPERMARQSDAMAARGDVAERLGEIACPAMMLWGSKDQFSNPREGLAMAAGLPNARFVEIPDCGHFPTIEAPVETLDAARHWLRAIPFPLG